jgi:poly(3-hydroxybutyrate) depolymerase
MGASRPMLYQLFEMQHNAMAPFRQAAKVGTEFWLNSTNPFSDTAFGRQAKASLHMFERLTRRYTKPSFDIDHTLTAEGLVDVEEHVVWEKPFCRMLHFRKSGFAASQKKVLIVAPMSGHFATLLRNTVEGMLSNHDVYVTDWVDARLVPVAAGRFDLDDYTDYVIEMLRHLGERAVVMAVCQPSVPVLVAVSAMNAKQDPFSPLSMILMGGPVDTRFNPTAVNTLAKEKGLGWFENNLLSTVPAAYEGHGRRVYPGFLQLAGFMSMNANRHVTAHRDMFWHVVEGEHQSVEKLQDFYDEYLSVMDLSAEFYLQTVDRVFIKQSLALGTYRYRDMLIDPAAITQTALLTIEGERDDITGPGQTQAAHALCSGLPQNMKADHVQKGVGHYGVFSGKRFQSDVVPVITTFIAEHNAA